MKTKNETVKENRQSSLLAYKPVFKRSTPFLNTGLHENNIDLHRNITSILHGFLAFVPYILVTMELLDLTFILYLLKVLISYFSKKAYDQNSIIISHTSAL